MASLVPADEAFSTFGGDASSVVEKNNKKRKRKPKKKKSKLSRAIDVILLIIIIGAFSGAAYFYFQNAGEAAAYNDLSNLAHRNTSTPVGSEGGPEAAADGGGAAGDTAAGDSGINWDELRAINEHVAAWINVENTPIDYAVVQAWEEDPDYWLHHDFWWNPGWWGCPFIDYRTHANAQHVLTYAHHLGDTDMMYTPLYRCYDQARFNEIGNLIWQTPEWGTTSFAPAFSMIVNQYDMTPQTFEWKVENMPDGSAEGAQGFTKEQVEELISKCNTADFEILVADDKAAITKALNNANNLVLSASSTQTELDKAYKDLYVQMENLNFHIWLINWASGATAMSPNLEDLLKNAERVITCVTCARSYTGLPDRTVVVFVANETK